MANGADKQIVFYEDWKKLGEENARLNRRPAGEKPRLAYDYSAYLALVCGVDARFPRAAEALKVLLDTTGGFPRGCWPIRPGGSCRGETEK